MMDPPCSETCWSTFKYFVILSVSTYYILCISWIVKCLTMSRPSFHDPKKVNDGTDCQALITEP